MPTRASETLHITTADLEKIGVYDAMIDYDSRLHIDPALLRSCHIHEFNNSVSIITAYFNDAFGLLKLSKRGGDQLWKAAVARLIFGEGLNN